MLIGIKVKANAKTNSIGDLVTIDGKQYLKISIKSPAENGKANLAIINFLASEWKIAKNKIEILKGHSSSLKILSINSDD